MKPIRKDEQEYMRTYIDNKFSNKRSMLESERQIEIDKNVSNTLEKFKKGLPGLDKLLKEVTIKNEAHEVFKNTMQTELEKRRNLAIDAAIKLEKKMTIWKKNRRWKESISFTRHTNDESPVKINAIDSFLEEVCQEEAIKAYDNSKKGVAIKQLDAQKEEAENALFSGGSLPAVRQYINGIFTNAGIADNVAKNLLLLSSK